MAKANYIEAPIELAERFLANEEAAFEVIRTVGAVRLWRSTAKPHPLTDGAPRNNVRYHVTNGVQAVSLLMSRLAQAVVNFELACELERSARGGRLV